MLLAVTFNNLPCDLSSGSEKATSITRSTTAHTNKNLSIKSSRAPSSNFQYGLVFSAAFWFDPNYTLLVSKSRGMRPLSVLVISFSWRPAMPIS